MVRAPIFSFPPFVITQSLDHWMDGQLKKDEELAVWIFHRYLLSLFALVFGFWLPAIQTKIFELNSGKC